MPPNPGFMAPIARLSTASGLAACLWIGGCTDAPTDSAPSSSNVSVAAPLIFDEAPYLSLGGVDAPAAQLFAAAEDAVLLPQDRLLVGDLNHQVLDEFGLLDGAHLARWSESGEGPGDNQGPRFLQTLAPDTVLMFDGGLDRFTVFLDGEALETFRAPERVGSVAGAESSEVVWFYRDFPQGASWDSQGLLAGAPFWVRRVGLRDGEVLDSIGPLPGRQGYRVINDDLFSTIDAPFSSYVSLAARDTLLVVAGHAGHTIDIYVHGTLGRSIAVPVPPRAVDEAAITAWVGEAAAGSDLRTVREMASEEVPLPEYLPSVQDVFIASDHAIWVHEYASPGEGQRWWRFNGEWRRIDLPVGLRVRVLAANDSIVVVRRIGDLDVTYVEAHRISECPAGAC